jgi:hypothetical protein
MQLADLLLEGHPPEEILDPAVDLGGRLGSG